VSETSGVLTVVMPIESRRVSNDAGVLQHRRVFVRHKIRARLKQQDPTSCIGTQSRGQNGSRRAAAYNKDIENLFPSVHVINRDRLDRDAHPGGDRAANDIFSPTP
jgi:hypothetical protein